ncbi:VWA domain-containing protein [Shewanella sp. NIFS-20-20]|uniref:vWA domain-containing protein n=1 Tax=Shewanella sp. NIFS-20-20 TaxID=2853806 RepID=UPI001C44FE4A|nr:VWA domain-containing protein [Shewanella sp. NIFS-20-20]MBV7315004.1 VWA domain-containing protein [Shewanella sp. NIFS-20-20]
MLTLNWPWLLLLLPLPILFTHKRQAMAGGELQLPGVATLGNQAVSVTHHPSKKPLYLIWLLLLIALARPMWLGEPIPLPTEGRDLMVAVDLSGSMQIEDMVIQGRTVDRLTLIQHVLSDFIERRQGDRLGLILFADHAYLQAPLTQDRRSISQYLHEAQIGLVGKQTAIGEAIGLAVKRFDNIDESNRVLILLTDGSSNAGNIEPLEAAEIAAKRGITIYTIGIGADTLTRRGLFGTEQINPAADLDESTLAQIASLTGGQYFRARDPAELARIYQDIDKLEPVSRDLMSYQPQTELFYWPLALMLILTVGLSLWQIKGHGPSLGRKLR